MFTTTSDAAKVKPADGRLEGRCETGDLGWKAFQAVNTALPEARDPAAWAGRAASKSMSARRRRSDSA